MSRIYSFKTGRERTEGGGGEGGKKVDWILIQCQFLTDAESVEPRVAPFQSTRE